MRCQAMLFNLEKNPSTRKPGTFNHFMTFVDMDTGESFRTYVDETIALGYQRLKQVDISLSLSMGEYNGKPQLNCRVIDMVAMKPLSESPAPVSEVKPDQIKPGLFPGQKTGTNG